MIIDDLFWNAPVADIKQGYIFEAQTQQYICLICGEQFEQGRIYKTDDTLMDAKKAMHLHVRTLHPPLVEYLLTLDKKLTGLTDTQKDLLLLAIQGKSDKEVAQQLGTSPSTVRNHRFNLRQKEKQAKVMLAIMELFSEFTPDKLQDFVHIHRRATMVDERFAITEKENEDVLAAYFPVEFNGKLKDFPRKEKRKLIILRHIAKEFLPGRMYTEKEVNAQLLCFYDDYVTLRRYLIEYGFLDRQRDGSSYWVKH